MYSANCPYCEAVVRVRKPYFGLQVTCKSCNTKLEVSWLTPLELTVSTDYSDSDDDFEYAGESFYLRE